MSRAHLAVLAAFLLVSVALPAVAHAAPSFPADVVAASRAASLQRLWIGGDSMTYQIESTLAARVRELGVPKVVSLGKSSSGLVRPDFFNWPAQLKKALASFHPQAVVFMVGTNDAQGMRVGSATYTFATKPWIKEYTKRVKAMMDAMHSAGVKSVYWIGMPIMKSAAFGKKMAVLNAVFRAQASAHAGVTYVDAWKRFATAKGAYVAKWRSADGMHFNSAGVNRLVAGVVALVRRDWL